MELLEVMVIVTVVLLLWMLARWDTGHYERVGIKALPYSVPLIGNVLPIMQRKKHFKDVLLESCLAYPGERYVGFTQLGRRSLIIKDADLLKKITVKDFDHFVDHQKFIDVRTDPLFGHNLFLLEGERWKSMRSVMSPTFTASKMKNMFLLVNECTEKTVSFLGEKIDSLSANDPLEVELKEIANRFTANVIGTAAFGVTIDAFRERDDKLYNMGVEAANFSGLQQFKIFLFIGFPGLMSLLAPLFGISIISDRVNKFFKNFVLANLKQREQLGVVRPDMIQLLMEVKKDWTDDEIVAQLAVFFIGGFDTTSTVITFAMYELAANEECQRKLQEEIDQIAKGDSYTLQYDDLVKMKYMDMVVSETMRKWPPALAIDRKCVKDYNLPPPNDHLKSGYTIRQNEVIIIPIFALHHDPKNFSDPETFDPERFSDENKDSIDPLLYIPFGNGPRGCIGKRFGMMVVKTMLFHIFKNFDLVTTPKSQIPVKIAIDSNNFQSESGFWFGMRHRK